MIVKPIHTSLYAQDLISTSQFKSCCKYHVPTRHGNTTCVCFYYYYCYLLLLLFYTSCLLNISEYFMVSQYFVCFIRLLEVQWCNVFVKQFYVLAIRLNYSSDFYQTKTNIIPRASGGRFAWLFPRVIYFTNKMRSKNKAFRIMIVVTNFLSKPLHRLCHNKK